jgi:hypothetical protein
MAQLQPVPKVPSPVAGREGAVAIALGIALLLAILKPWGPETGVPSSSPTPSVAGASAAPAEDRELHTALFGPFEPTPEWSIWPAGYFVSVMYVARAPRSASGAGASWRPDAEASERPLPGSEWPSSIEVGAEDHLLWLGIDTPRGYSLDTAVLHRIEANGAATPVEIRRVPSPWPSHFTVLALASGGARSALAVWPAGDYRLELTASPGEVRHTVEIRIRTVPTPGDGLDRPQR